MRGGYQRFNRLPILPPGSLPLHSLRVLPIGAEVDGGHAAARAMSQSSECRARPRGKPLIPPPYRVESE
jgi:hypothetical protein